MLRRFRDRLDFTRRLGFRLGALLSVAILPIGLISLVQNLHLSREAQRSAEIALLGRTASAAAGERALLQSALGSADALGPAVLDVLDQPDSCSDLMRNFIDRSAIYVYAGFVPTGGRSNCTSALDRGQLADMRQSPAFQKFMADPATLVTSVQRGVVSGRSVVLVMQPLYRDRDLLGYVGISLTHDLLRSTHSVNFGTEGARIVTFNNRGEILTSDSATEGQASDILPADIPLLGLLSRNETTFRARANTGEMRVFTVVPVVPGLVYALGSWSSSIAGVGLFQLSQLGAVLFPIALWLVSLAVAYFAVFRLVLRHITVLRGQMRRFAIGNRDEPPPVLTDAPTEILDVSQTFHNMARILIRDEETMEEAVNEKTVLLKEVHHRVKNNLQLIASIINMQSRMIGDTDAKRVLRSVQDRVAALATIYRNLYQAEHLDAVEADRLIGDIINQMVNASVGPGRNLGVETRLQPMTLLPDQAVPLSLLATEAFTNALKYAGTPPGGDGPWVRVTLTAPEPGRGLLEIANSLGANEMQGETEGTGLGSQLIEAFSTQLEGEASAGIEGDCFVLRLGFAIDEAGLLPGADVRNVVLTSAAREGARH
ncbi:sensor histidine kinase [Paracoccus spongiarum]|uniref:histidine kinase n=1 Tax=Paracoccus spongiarum TaxID=3064387 RepID=A0ABT9JBB7_9RHOB|nr:histidine kinase dimerization/phosphoacceptor domain -containing protein [Paracoccus sp. 2205BS29-5]MDP5307010.1 histidine kinase dimerization/phosphoacceptor domain -containing protein [Paracoccus sp. 2205BS29-5]